MNTVRKALVVRVTIDGKQKNMSVEKARELGLSGTYYEKLVVDGKVKWKSLGKDHGAARIAVIRERKSLAGTSGPVSDKPTVQEAIDAFVLERSASQDASSVRRWQWELNRFASLTDKAFLHEIGREDVTAYWNSFKAENAAPRTIFNRVQSLCTFLKNRGLNVEEMLKNYKMPTFDEKDVDYYTETNPDELTDFFTFCDIDRKEDSESSPERLAFLFFLYSGCREREVMHACWDDIDFVNRTYTVRPKPDLRFRTKNGQVRLVPLPQVLVDALKAYVCTIPARRLIFVNTQGKPEGHFLYKCKQIAHKAQLNCGHCVNKKGLSCAKHAVCAKWSLHKFRRTWATMNLLSGMPITLLQNYIGHSDLETLNRYLARISAKTDLAKQMADNMAKMTNIQGTVAADMMVDLVKV